MAKLKELNSEQKKIVDDISYEFISPLKRKINEEFAKDGLETLFRLCGLPKPTIYIVESPRAAKKRVQELDRNYISNKNWKYGIEQKIETYVLRQEIIVRKQIDNLVDDNIRDFFREKAGHYRRAISLEFLQNVHDRVRSQIFIDSNEGHRSIFYDNIFIHDMIRYLPWISFYLHFKKLGILDNELFDACYKYSQSGIFMNMYFIDIDVVILIKNPLYVINDNKGRISNKEGYAIEWSDGYGIHFVNGVHFDKELYYRIFVDKTIKGKDILLLRDTEQKTIAIQQYGYHNMIKDIGAKKIDEMQITTKMGKAFNELYHFEIGSKEEWRRIRGRFVKVVDHSTGKITCLGVPIEKSTETVRGAIAWTFQLDEKEYNPAVET